MTISDINTETRSLCDADSTSLTNATLLIRVNNAYEEIIGNLIALNKNWNFGDSNYTALPTGLKTLTAGTQAYQFDSTYLNVLRVEVKDADGTWRLLAPIKLGDITVGQAEYYKTNGLPIEYEKREDFILLYPAPAAANVTLTNGLKVYFQRTADVFTAAQVTTGTKTPGFASPYHILICYKAAMIYCTSYKKDRVPMILSEIARLEKELLDFYALREKDIIPRFTISSDSNK